MNQRRIGPFEVYGKLGSNRRHHVYHARQVEQGRDVALKFLSVPPEVQWATALQKIDREVDILKKLKHPRLVEVLGAGVDGDRVFLACELVEGETLAAILARRGRLAPDLAIHYARQIAQALEFLHEHEILHSKLTADKILVQPDDQLKVGDLRLNRSRRRRWDDGRKHQLETAAYLAPEQLLQGLATPKSDLYSLGVIMFEMITGRLPFEPENLSRTARQKTEARPPSAAGIAINCPIWLDRLIGQLLQPSPKRRPHSARAVIMALDEIHQVEQTRKTAVEELTRGFNPLSAGADKREARRLMGIKEEPVQRAPLWHRTSFLVVGLLIIVVVVAIAVRPTSTKTLFEKAQQLMQSDQPEDWGKARHHLEEIMRRRSASMYAEQAEQLYYESRRRWLLHRVEIGLVGLESQDVRRFYVAYSKERDGRFEEAMEIYRELMENNDPQGDQRHIHLESKTRLEQLSQQTAALAQVRQRLSDAVQLAADGQADQALEIYREILQQHRGDAAFEALLSEAQRGLDALSAREDEDGK